MFRSIIAITAIAAIVGFAICMVIGAYYGFRANQHRASGAPYKLIVALNLYNAGWFSNQLDEIGQRYRTQAAHWMLTAIACMAVFGAVLVLELIH
jgi:hypothetical protein